MIGFKVGEMRLGEEEKVSRFIEEVFSEHVDPLYSRQGQVEFRKYIDPAAFKDRDPRSHFRLVAETGTTAPELIGMIEMRDFNHVCLLFVSTKYQNQGVGRRLVDETLRLCRQRGVESVTVNSSPNAVPAYRAFGFVPTDIEKTIHGIRFVPMKLDIRC